MKHQIDLAERIAGTYWQAAAILKLELGDIVQAPLEELRFEIGSSAVTRRVRADVGPLISGPGHLRVPLHWKAAEHPNLFPAMEGELDIGDVEGSQIEVRLVGEYCTPLAAVGAVADALAGRRVAENSLHGFLTEVTRRLSARLVEHTAGVGASSVEGRVRNPHCDTIAIDPFTPASPIGSWRSSDQVGVRIPRCCSLPLRHGYRGSPFA
jgi:hypothetical protein